MTDKTRDFHRRCVEWAKFEGREPCTGFGEERSALVVARPRTAATRFAQTNQVVSSLLGV